jgi:transcriptional regulator with XRE-family HTH domain
MAVVHSDPLPEPLPGMSLSLSARSSTVGKTSPCESSVPNASSGSPEGSHVHGAGCRPDAPSAATSGASSCASDQSSSEARRRLHRIRTVRIQQGITLRTVARHTGLPVRVLREQENEATDLRLSDVYRWQRVLEVPASELLLEDESPLSRPVLERAQLVKIMKTALTIQQHANRPGLQRLADTLVAQLVTLMPELAHVAPWPVCGQRRTLDELGRIAQQPISEDWLFGQHWEDE